MKTSKPTVEEIKILSASCKKIYKPLFEEFDKDNTYYELEFGDKLLLPSKFSKEGFILPTGRDVVDAIVDHTDLSHPRISCDNEGTSNVSIERAEMMEKFGRGLLYETNMEADISPIRVSGKHFWLHGLTCIKTVWDADRWFDKPEKRENESDSDYEERIEDWRNEYPPSLSIIIQPLHPANVMPDPYYGGRLFVIESHKKIRLDIDKKYPHWTNPQNRRINEEVEHDIYFDKDYRCDLIDGEPILNVKGGVAKHKYGFIPYTFTESGLGNLDKDGTPVKRYVGLLRYMRDLLVSDSQMYTMANILLKFETMKGGYTTGADANTVTDIPQEYGVYKDVGTKDVVFHDWERKLPPAALFDFLGLTHDYINKHSASPSLFGLSQPGVRSGAHERIVGAESLSKLNYSKDAFASGWANVLTKCALIVKNVLPGDFELRAGTSIEKKVFRTVIKKEMFKEPFNFHVEFSPISPEDEYRRHIDLEQLLASGIVTKQFARRQMPNIDSIAMEREEEKEKLKQSPAYLALVNQMLQTAIQEKIKEAGTPITGLPTAPTETTAAGLPIGSPPGAGGRLSPPVREVPTPGSAQDIMNKMRTQYQIPKAAPNQGLGGGGSRV